MPKRHRLTDEERVAKKISDLISHLALDIEMVGVYLAELAPRVAINRILLMAEIAKQEKDGVNDEYRVY
jgi:hypothetical protein